MRIIPVLPLDRAAFCLDCDVIFPLALPACPACGSTTVAALARWLSRPAVAA